MDVTVDVAGGEAHEVSIGDEATYADLLARVDLNREAAAVLVDGRPVPTDAPVDADRVRVVRLVKGG